MTPCWQQELETELSRELCSSIWYCLSLLQKEHGVYKSSLMGGLGQAIRGREGVFFPSTICMLFCGFLMYCLASSTLSI